MKQRIVIVLVAILLPAVAIAQESDKYRCTYGDMQRRVQIAHEPGVEVPCSVHYFKDSEMPGEQQVLWSADSDPTYCQNKAQELITKLGEWGWDCGRDGETIVEEEVVDDEDVVDDVEAVVPDELLGDPDAPEAPDLEQ